MVVGVMVVSEMVVIIFSNIPCLEAHPHNLVGASSHAYTTAD